MKLLIAGISMIVAAVIAATIYIGSRSFEGLVTEHPYEIGLMWDTLRRERLASGLTMQVLTPSFEVGKNTVVVALIDRHGNSVRAAASLTLSRLDSASFDRTYPLEHAPDGTYSTTVDIPRFGSWDLQITVEREGGRITFGKRIYVEKGRVH